MPVEFAVAAYRLGHSMVRPGYRLNDNDVTLLPIFPVPTAVPPLLEGLTGFRSMNPNWGIDWGRFIDIDVRAYDTPGDVKKRLQFCLSNRYIGGQPAIQFANPSRDWNCIATRTKSSPWLAAWIALRPVGRVLPVWAVEPLPR